MDPKEQYGSYFYGGSRSAVAALLVLVAACSVCAPLHFGFFSNVSSSFSSAI
jgi:hypothetical protein